MALKVIATKQMEVMKKAKEAAEAARVQAEEMKKAAKEAEEARVEAEDAVLLQAPVLNPC